MRVNLFKLGMARIIIVTVLGLFIVGAVTFGVRAYQTLLQDQSSDEEYD